MAEDRLTRQAAESSSTHPNVETGVVQRCLVPVDDIAHALQLYKAKDVDGADGKPVVLKEKEDLLLYLVARFTMLDTSEENRPALHLEPETRRRVEAGSDVEKPLSSQKHRKASGNVATDMNSKHLASNKARRISQMPPRPLGTQTSFRSREDPKRQHKTRSSPFVEPGMAKELDETDRSARNIRERSYERKKDVPSNSPPFSAKTSTGEDDEKWNNESRTMIDAEWPFSDGSYRPVTPVPADDHYPKKSGQFRPQTAKHISPISSSDDDRQKDENAGVWVRYDGQDRGYYSSAAAPADPRSSLGKIQALQDQFYDKWEPECREFVLFPPQGFTPREKEYRRLSESVMRNIIEAADAVEVGDDVLARRIRRDLIREAQELLHQIDRVSK